MMKRRNRIAIAMALVAGGALAATELPAYFRAELMGTRIVKPSDLRTIQSQEGEIQQYFQAPTSTLLNLGQRHRAQTQVQERRCRRLEVQL